MIRIILTFVMLLTACMIPFPVSGQSDNGEYPVWFNDEVYIVDDPDGYANMRSGPGSKYSVVGLRWNKEVLCRNKNRKIVDGWVPIYSYYDSTQYIHNSRLLPMDKLIAEKISSYAANDYPVFAVGRNFPNIVVIQWSEGFRDVIDLKVVDFTAPNSDMKGSILPPVENLGIMWGDTLSFYKYEYDYNLPEEYMYQQAGKNRLPKITIYKLYNKGSKVSYTTRHFPELQKTSKPEKGTSPVPEQLNDATFFIVNDPDGYVNMRTGPGSQYESMKILSQTVIQRNQKEKIINGWIPVTIDHSDGYIYQDRLRPVDPSVVSMLDTLYNPPTWRLPRFAYSAGKDFSKLFVIEKHIENLQLLDATTGKNIFPYLEYFRIIESDPLTLYAFHSYGDFFHDDLYPMLVLYKLYHKNGEPDYYTEIFPQPRKVSRDWAEAIVKTARNVLARECNGNMQKFTEHLDFLKHCGLLFLAYCSGVDDALKVVDFKKFPYEIRNMFDAYQRSQYKLKR